MIRHLRGLAAAVTAFALAGAAVAGPSWTRADTSHFIVLSDASSERITRYASDLEAYHDTLAQFFGVTTEDDDVTPRLKVYLLASHGDLDVVWPGASDEIGGFFTHCREDEAAFPIVQSDKVFASSVEDISETVMFHEYAHSFMDAYSDRHFPRWFEEGFAEYYSTARIDGRSVVIGNVSVLRSWELEPGEYTLPWDEVLRGRWPGSDKANANQLQAFYAQAWLLTHYLLSDPGRAGKLDAYWDALDAGQDPAAAFEAVFGIKTSQLHHVLKDYLSKGLPGLKFTLGGDSAQATVTAMPASAQNLLMLDAGVRVCQIKDDSNGRLTAIRTEAARYPGDAYAQRVLARAEMTIGDPSVALRILRTLAAASPSDAEVQAMLGETWFRLARGGLTSDGEAPETEMQHARDAMAAAYRLDPRNAANLYYYSLAQDGGGLPDDNAVNAAMQAYNLIPGNSEYAFRAAELLVRKGRSAEARPLLARIADSHGDTDIAALNRALAAIDAGASADDIASILYSTDYARTERGEPWSDAKKP